jgi:predicted lysophospholipase L1 biosynthesis ABC-type transport system permease subunit
VFSAVALVNILIVMTTGSGRDFAQMRLLGATHRQTGQMVWLEALMVTLIACLIGGAISGVHLAQLSRSMIGSWTPAMSWIQVAGLARRCSVSCTGRLVPYSTFTSLNPNRGNQCVGRSQDAQGERLDPTTSLTHPRCATHRIPPRGSQPGCFPDVADRAAEEH